MGDQNKTFAGTTGKAIFALFLGCLISANAAAVIDGTGSRVIDGTGSYVIDGTGGRVIDGTGSRVIDGTGSYVIDGTGGRVIDGTGSRVIDGTGSYVIDGTGGRVIDGTGALIIESDYLLARGQIDYIGDGFLSVLGQTVFDNGAGFGGLTAGMTIAIYGAIDLGTGGFVDTQIMKLAPVGVDAGVADFLRGIVDAVDTRFGMAVIGGMTVDYTAMLSNGRAPQIGDEIAVTGRNYRDLGLLIASP